MAKPGRIKKPGLELAKSGLKIKQSSDVYKVLDRMMDTLREMDGKDLQKKVDKMMAGAKKQMIKPVVASVKHIKKIIPKGKKLKKAQHTFDDSKSLNELMKESLKDRDFKNMSAEEIEKFYKVFDDKLDLPNVKSGKYIEIRNPPAKIYKDGDAIYHEVEISESLGERQGGEKQYLEARSRFGRDEVVDMERAHSVGPGLGMDSPYGLYFAPKAVNQALQNRGVEAFIGILHETLKKEGKKIKITTRTKPHKGTHRLNEIAYKIDIIDEKGNTEQLLQYAISIGNDKVPPSIAHNAISKNNSLAKKMKLEAKMRSVETANTNWKSYANNFLADFFD